MSVEESTLKIRLRTAFELFEAGEAMMRMKIAREYPELSEAEVETRLVAWLRHRPGAERGDCPGPPYELR